MSDDLRRQLEITKRFLEVAHGRALEYGTPSEARAYYEALKDIDTALECGWQPDAEVLDADLPQRFAEASREARAEGYRAATRADDERANRREKYRRETVFSRLFG